MKKFLFAESVNGLIYKREILSTLSDCLRDLYVEFPDVKFVDYFIGQTL